MQLAVVRSYGHNMQCAMPPRFRKNATHTCEFLAVVILFHMQWIYPYMAYKGKIHWKNEQILVWHNLGSFTNLHHILCTAVKCGAKPYRATLLAQPNQAERDPALEQQKVSKRPCVVNLAG